jgi:hypothetical protein
MPPAFRLVPEGFEGGRVRVRAVIGDLMETMFGDAPEALLAAFDKVATTKVELNRLQWVLAAAHVLWHPTLRSASPQRTGVEKLLVQDLSALAVAVPSASLVSDEERREELARRVLAAAGLRLPGESATQAADRLKQVDSVERRRVLAAAAERERRSREVREMMARKAAEEAAAKVSRE